MALNKYSDTELLGYPNCLGLSEKGQCIWLTLPKCQGPDCPFLKTKDAMACNEPVFERLRSLAEKDQSRISKKYYGGKRPWINNPKL